MESVELEVLKLLEENARMSEEEIAEVLALPVDRVKEIIKKFEDDGVILKYKAIVDWEKLQEDFVYALINVKVSLTREKGYDDIAKRIAKFSEVHAVRLVSGEYDFQVVVKGKSLKDIAFFVAEKISTIPEVRDTFTHFVLRTYKEEGVNLFEDEEDRRLAFVP
ncbi:Lrp/AsnC family transcriptional regulator [Archaeoglobus fulgidus]|uniref:Leucine responsive regulatory protein (Lrp) n=2 Tax=Archaeoglobus fulgidus TaxID=2234 RepID=O28651_ARCFU|nr:Lrp/AsnC family transcriptional regulator [Archaeoglobus fulgidus]AAB89621.1 leucine responsive regulatory protein (lrp) [Archaeoglobus fulgidus DSM 4304]KUJ93854.1 MAG: Leucine responsive regulatory protein (Lrp) [Archaeoglobus fulgidus]KUK07309.1 MAG: Leucine responsive regulatory protein (Lrp) [Archaeoglobus fulgidus]